MNTLNASIRPIRSTFFPSYWCTDGSGKPSHSVGETLLAFLSTTKGELLDEFEKDVLQGRAKVVNQIHQPDWNINDICVWIDREPARPGWVCIANENTEYSSEDGQMQQFTLSQVLQAIRFWKKFLIQLEEKGPEEMSKIELKEPMLDS